MSASQAPRAVFGARRTLEQLVGRLDHRADIYERGHDSRCVFPRAYALLTRRIADELPIAGFEDPEWVTRLVVSLSEQYFRAVSEHNPHGFTRNVWSTVLEADDDHQTSVNEALLLGITTLFVHDLPLALCEVGLGTRTGKGRLADYHALSEIIAPAIEDIEHSITERYGSWLHVADHLNVVHAAVLTNQGMRIAHATAWYNAQRLQDAKLSLSARAAIRRWPRIMLDDLLHPRALSSHMMARGARLVSRLTRHWPGHTPAK